MLKSKQKRKALIAAMYTVCSYAENEENISLSEFIYELKCALRQSFIGLITENDGVIHYVMLNGQKFKIEVKS